MFRRGGPGMGLWYRFKPTTGTKNLWYLFGVGTGTKGPQIDPVTCFGARPLVPVRPYNRYVRPLVPVWGWNRYQRSISSSQIDRVGGEPLFDLKFTLHSPQED